MMYEPSKRRIRRMTNRIKKTWDQRTRLIRAGYPPELADIAGQWKPPQVDVAEVERITGFKIQLQD